MGEGGKEGEGKARQHLAGGSVVGGGVSGSVNVIMGEEGGVR